MADRRGLLTENLVILRCRSAYDSLARSTLHLLLVKEMSTIINKIDLLQLLQKLHGLKQEFGAAL
jgi:hypothetical protein